MLILTRKVGEKILIKLSDEETIELIVVSKSHNRVSLGIEAPKHINIVREELLGRKS